MANSFFYQLLEAKGVSEHDGRPLWKYNLTNNEYIELKKRLNKILRYNIDPRDITLYFAEWWKNEYNGGVPTIQEVYSALNGCILDCNDFYKFAKRGLVLLGIPIIKGQYRFYFRTLLMQGGLPINHLLKNSGSYTNFLKKVLEINPSTIEEFAYDNEIIRYLPYSSRNEAVYESCLYIVDAIWSGNEEYLEIFETKSTSTSSFKKISDELKQHKNQIERSVRRRAKFKAFWVLYAEDDIVKLEFNFPEIIEKENFTEFTQISKNELFPEYNLIIEDSLVCKFRQNIKGDYKVVWFNNSKVLWNGEEVKPDIYLSTQDSRRYKFPVLMVDSPKFSEPSLWTKIEENKWKLEQGKYCKDEKGIVLFPPNWNTNSENNIFRINLFEKSLYWIEFENAINLSSESDVVTFKTNTTSFDWFVMESKPNWIVKANMPVVSKAPPIIAYRKSGEKIESIKKYWRFFGDIVWREWNNTNMPLGCIEFKIEALDCQEIGVFYNIGSLNIDFETYNQTQDKAKIKIESNCNLSFQIKNNDLYEVDEKSADFILTLRNYQKGVKTIPALTTNPNQRRSLHFEIISPFQGAQILSPEGNVLEKETTILLHNLIGFRIVSQTFRNSYFVKIYNTKKTYIKIFKTLSGNIVPLREFENIVSKLFRLTDAMDKETAVALELYNSSGELQNRYFFRSFNTSLKYNVNESNTVIEVEPNDNKVELFAVPLDCSPYNINLSSLEKENDCFIIPENIIIDKYIIFSGLSNNTNNAILPHFVTTNYSNNPTDEIDREQRIEQNKNRLQEENAMGVSWQRLLKYFKTCSINEIPYSTFDVLRASVRTPELAAKLFCFLSVNNQDENFIEKTCKDIENDLGICFHWIAKKHWDNSINWIKSSFDLSDNSQDEVLLREMVLTLINDSEPIHWFQRIANTIVQGENYTLDNCFLNEDIQLLRQSLGERVLNELPQICPKIPDRYKPILPVTYDTRFVKILLKTPLAVALSMTGLFEKIWNNNGMEETIRRNIQYCQWIAPNWYGKAILYCLNQLRTQNLI